MIICELLLVRVPDVLCKHMYSEYEYIHMWLYTRTRLHSRGHRHDYCPLRLQSWGGCLGGGAGILYSTLVPSFRSCTLGDEYLFGQLHQPAAGTCVGKRTLAPTLWSGTSWELHSGQNGQQVGSEITAEKTKTAKNAKHGLNCFPLSPCRHVYYGMVFSACMILVLSSINN